MQLLTYCTVHTLVIQFAIAEMNDSAYKRYFYTHIQMHYTEKHTADTEHTIQRRSNHCVVCLRSLYQFYYYIYSMIIISDSLHFSHSVALQTHFFSVRAVSALHTHTLQENALFHTYIHVYSVYMLYFACEMMCAVLLLLIFFRAHCYIKVV